MGYWVKMREGDMYDIWSRIMHSISDDVILVCLLDLLVKGICRAPSSLSA